MFYKGQQQFTQEKSLFLLAGCFSGLPLNPFLILNLLLHILNGIRRLHIQRNCLTCKSLHKDLHCIYNGTKENLYALFLRLRVRRTFFFLEPPLRLELNVPTPGNTLLKAERRLSRLEKEFDLFFAIGRGIGKVDS